MCIFKQGPHKYTLFCITLPTVRFVILSFATVFVTLVYEVRIDLYQ